MRYIDLTHTFGPKMPVYPGDQQPKLVPSRTLEQNGATDFDLHTGMHVGTHIDGPLHMIPGSPALNELPIERFVAAATIVDVRGVQNVGPDNIPDDLSKASAVVFYTGWSDNYGNDTYYHEYPVITEAAGEKLVRLGAAMVGIDGPSPDQPPFAVHKILLREKILIIENLTNLEALVGHSNITLFALPMKVAADSAPVRVVAQL